MSLFTHIASRVDAACWKAPSSMVVMGLRRSVLNRQGHIVKIGATNMDGKSVTMYSIICRKGDEPFGRYRTGVVAAVLVLTLLVA